MFDATKNIDPASEFFPEARRHTDVLQGRLDEVYEPLRKPSTSQHLEGPCVVNGVEGFSGVKEENKTLRVVFDTLEEVVVDLQGVVHPILTPEEAFLRGIHQGGDSGHNNVGHSGG